MKNGRILDSILNIVLYMQHYTAIIKQQGLGLNTLTYSFLLGYGRPYGRPRGLALLQNVNSRLNMPKRGTDLQALDRPTITF